MMLFDPKSEFQWIDHDGFTEMEYIMNKRSSILALSVITLAMLAGCSWQTTPVERFYGTSYNLAKESQIDNPFAGVASGPPTGLEGPVAALVIDRYEQGFAKPAAKTETYSVSFDGMKVK